MNKSNRIMILLTIVAVNISCNDIGREDDHSNIADPLSRWRAYNVKGYSLNQTLLCGECIDGGLPMRIVVRDNHIVDVSDVSTGSSIPKNHWLFFKTVDELFEIARNINPDSVAHFTIEYDRKYGFPSRLYIDQDEGVVDEEYGYGSQFISRN